MTYFISEKQRKESGSTCFFEFQKGEYEDECWKEDSLSISDEEFDRLKLGKLITEINADFDYYGNTEISYEQWELLKNRLIEKNGEYKKLLSKLQPWAEENFKQNKIFTIIGL